ncbi:MAG: HAD hydrolase-like protein [Kiritimatiellia bacterium]|jgi:phosphoglycolate phosphatase
MAPSPVGLLLYDLDGTLADTRGDLAEAVNHARSTLGLAPWPLERIIPGVGDGVRRLIERSIPERPDAVDAATAAMVAYYADHPVVHTVLYPGVAETLAALRAQGWSQAVVTNKLSSLSRPILGRLGVREMFDALVGGADCPRMKPDPMPLRVAIGRALREDDPRRTGPIWMIGDNHTDLAAARAAGLKRCFCRFGFGNPKGEAWDAAIDRFDDLPRCLAAPQA